jgi:hypothetical protein
MVLEIAITLIVGFALGFGFREWIFCQTHRGAQRRRPSFLMRAAEVILEESAGQTNQADG